VLRYRLNGVMSPIDNVRARQAAFHLLDVPATADQSAIRAAWRRIAFEAHPDRNGGSYDAFMRAKAAYDLLREGKEDAGTRRTTPRRTARPKVTPRVEPLSAEAIDACRGVLAPDAEESVTGLLPVMGEDGAPDATTDHVPEAVGRCGRTLTYIVPNCLAPGRNRIALPTAILEDNRRVKPRIVTVTSRAGGPGEIRVPDALRERLFPGARAVTIRFAEA